MARVLNLKDVFKLINNRLTNSSFTQQNSIAQRGDQLGFHVFSKFGYQVDSLVEELIKKFFGDVAFIPVEFAKQLVDKSFHPQGATIIGIGCREHNVHDVTCIAGDLNP